MRIVIVFIILVLIGSQERVEHQAGSSKTTEVFQLLQSFRKVEAEVAKLTAQNAAQAESLKAIEKKLRITADQETPKSVPGVELEEMEVDVADGTRQHKVRKRRRK